MLTYFMANLSLSDLKLKPACQPQAEALCSGWPNRLPQHTANKLASDCGPEGEGPFLKIGLHHSLASSSQGERPNESGRDMPGHLRV
jgi:hypothetical protein